jgi:hypothetical protein
MKIKINGKEIVNKIRENEVYQTFKPEIKLYAYTFVGSSILLILFPYAPVLMTCGLITFGVAGLMISKAMHYGFKQLKKSR